MTTLHKEGETGNVSKALPAPANTLTAYTDRTSADLTSKNNHRAIVALTVCSQCKPFSINSSMTRENGQSTQQPIAV